MDEKKSFSREDALSALKLAFHALIRSGESIEEILDQANSILQDLIESDEFTVLSASSLGLIKEDHINKLGDISFDILRRTIFYRGQKAELSPKENLLMEHFFKNPSKVITHKEITEYIFTDDESDRDPPEFCRPLISRLRGKLATFPGGEKWIETVRGKGYVFVGDKKI